MSEPLNPTRRRARGPPVRPRWCGREVVLGAEDRSAKARRRATPTPSSGQVSWSITRGLPGAEGRRDHDPRADITAVEISPRSRR